MRDKYNTLTNFRKWIEDEEKLQKFLDWLRIGDVFEFEGTYSIAYNSSIISEIRKVEPEEYNLEDFGPVPQNELGELRQTLFEVIESIENSYLRELLDNLFSAPKIRDNYFNSPSSTNIHHAYQHGNLEHTVSMLKLLGQLIAFYDKETHLNLDLLKTGIILHDIGKIKEYTVNNTIPVRAQDDGLLSHQILGDHILVNSIREIEGFPKDLENKLRHIIISHHGLKEWGSPIEPKFPEAEFIHYMDLIDSQFALKSTL
ncbi:MAG: HD domain-containing protein [Promethearchaeia archaeon]